MNAISSVTRQLFLLLPLVAIVACSHPNKDGGTTSIVEPEPSVVRLTVTSPAAYVTGGEPVQLTATGFTSSGAERPLTTTATWTSSDPGILPVTPSGAVTAGRPGRARITATYSSASASLDLVVPSIAAQPRTVRLIYLAPQDREFRADYDRAVLAAFVDLQDWYRRQLDGPVFTLYGLQVDHCRLTQPADYYLADSYAKVLQDARRCLPVRLADTTTTWVLYADVGHGCDLPGRLGVGSPGVTIMGQEDLQGLNDEPRINDGCREVPKLTLGRWRGGGGHELGHAFGLPHPPGCDANAADCDRNALMWSGYSNYPNTYLRDDNKATLRSSPFFGIQQRPASLQWDADGRPQ